MKKNWLVCLVVVLVLSACQSKKSPLNVKREVTDMAGRTMQVPDTIRRVYVNKPGNLVLYAIDPELAICRSFSVDKTAQPYIDSAYAALPYTDGLTEEIVKLKPDVIINCFTISDETSNEADLLAEKTGIPVFQVEIDMTEYAKTFDILGELLNRETQTNRMDSFVNTYLDTIAARAALIPEEEKIRVYYAEGECGLQTDPSGSVHSQVIDFVGGINVARVDILPGKGMSSVSMEQVLLWDPDLILCWTGWGESMTTYQCITSDGVWQTLRAVKNNEVYQIPYAPYGWFDRPPGTNRIIGTIWTAHLLYPDVFPYDMRKVTREYFQIFYHRDLTDDELDDLLNPTSEGLLQTSLKIGNEKK